MNAKNKNLPREINNRQAHKTMHYSNYKKYFQNKLKSYFTGVFFISILFLGLFGLAESSSAEPWTGIINANRATDWSVAGVANGIPNNTTICSTLNPGATAAQINSAIAACPANQVVYLNAGTYSLAGEIVMKSYVTLRGAGADQTILNFSSGGQACNLLWTEHIGFCGGTNWTGAPQNTATWTAANYNQGQTTITLSSTANLYVGNFLLIDQLDDTSATDGLLVSDSTNFSTEGGSNCRGLPGSRRCQAEYQRVIGINGNVVTISPGLMMPNWSAAKSPGAWWSSILIRSSGIEEMTISHGGNNLTGVAFNNAVDCWMKGVKSVYATTGGDWGRAHVHAQNSGYITVRDSYLYGTRNAANLSYGIEIFNGGNWLIENNIFHHVVAGIVPGSTVGSVYGYNYGIDHFYVNAAWNMLGPVFNHDGGNSKNLSEGNQGTGTISDNVHGTTPMNTYFRNQFIGRGDPSKTMHNTPIEFNAYARFQNVIGNVLGEAGYHNAYESYPGNSSNCTSSMYALGFSGFACGMSPYPETDVRVRNSLFRWGNYDTFNNVVRWENSEVPSSDSYYPNAVPGSQYLPASFYLTSKPAWFGSVPWPPVGPDVTGGNVISGSGAASTLGGHAYKIPARLCYENTSKTNGVLNFNANNCYASVGGGDTTAPSAPTGLSVL